MKIFTETIHISAKNAAIKKWVVLHDLKNSMKMKNDWQIFSLLNYNKAQKTHKGNTERVKAYNGAHKGFETGIFQRKKHQKIYVAFVCDIDPTNKKLDDLLDGHHVELFMTVTYEPKLPIVTHMGIARSLQYQGIKTSKIAKKFHAMVAKIMMQNVVIPNTENIYMVTTPLLHMGKILADIGAKKIKSDPSHKSNYAFSINQKEGLITVKLTDTTVVADIKTHPWISQLIFSQYMLNSGKPVAAPYNSLAKQATNYCFFLEV